MSSGHPGFLAIVEEIKALHLKKSADYGLGTDALANCRASADFGVPGWVGTMIRAHDKVIRIKAFLANGRLENESLEDSLLDLANYAIIALALRREEQAAEQERYYARVFGTPQPQREERPDDQFEGILSGMVNGPPPEFLGPTGFPMRGETLEKAKRVHAATQPVAHLPASDVVVTDKGAAYYAPDDDGYHRREAAKC